ncbi:MAG TPA: hypothetical protein VI011_07485 [Asanoa sp.]
MSDTALRRLGYMAGVAWVALTVAGLALYLPSVEAPFDLLEGNVANNAALALSLGVMAPVLTTARPRNPLGWLLHALAAINAVVIACSGYAVRAVIEAPGSLPWGRYVALGAALWPLAFAPMFTVLLEVYPSGRPTSRWGRLLVGVSVAAALAASAALALADESYNDLLPGSVDPIATRAMQPVVEIVAAAAALVLLATALATFGHTAVRLRRASSPEREHLAWLAAVTLPLLVATFLARPRRWCCSAYCCGRSASLSACCATGCWTFGSSFAARWCTPCSPRWCWPRTPGSSPASQPSFHVACCPRWSLRRSSRWGCVPPTTCSTGR